MSNNEYEYNNDPGMSNDQLREMTNADINRLMESGDMTDEILEGLIRVGKLTQAQINAKVAAQAARAAAENAAAKQALLNQRIRNFPTRRATRILRGQPGLAARIARAKESVRSKKNAIDANIRRAKANLETRQNIEVIPPEIPDRMWDEEPQFAQLLLSSHQEEITKKKRQALNEYIQASLEALRTNTNETTKDLIRQIHNIPKHARPTFVILAKLDDVYGKLKRNLDIAETNSERQRIAPKKYEVDRLRREVRAVMDKQAANPSLSFPVGLMKRVDAALGGENVSSLLAPTRTAANRLSEAITAYETAKEARYSTLKNQMKGMTNDSMSRQKIWMLAALEEALVIVSSQPVTNKSGPEITKELEKLNELKSRIEQAIANKTPVDLMDKARISKVIADYALYSKISNGLYSRLKKNQNAFNQANFNAKQTSQTNQTSMIPLAAFAQPQVPVAPIQQPSPAERRRLMAEAAAQRLAKPSKGGKTRRTRRNRKN